MGRLRKFLLPYANRSRRARKGIFPVTRALKSTNRPKGFKDFMKFIKKGNKKYFMRILKWLPPIGLCSLSQRELLSVYRMSPRSFTNIDANRNTVAHLIASSNDDDKYYCITSLCQMVDARILDTPNSQDFTPIAIRLNHLQLRQQHQAQRQAVALQLTSEQAAQSSSLKGYLTTGQPLVAYANSDDTEWEDIEEEDETAEGIGYVENVDDDDNYDNSLYQGQGNLEIPNNDPQVVANFLQARDPRQIQELAGQLIYLDDVLESDPHNSYFFSAILNGNLPLVEFLIESANLMYINDREETIWDCVNQSNNPLMLQTILARIVDIRSFPFIIQEQSQPLMALAGKIKNEGSTQESTSSKLKRLIDFSTAARAEASQLKDGETAYSGFTNVELIDIARQNYGDAFRSIYNELQRTIDITQQRNMVIKFLRDMEQKDIQNRLEQERRRIQSELQSGYMNEEDSYSSSSSSSLSSSSKVAAGFDKGNLNSNSNSISYASREQEAPGGPYSLESLSASVGDLFGNSQSSSSSSSIAPSRAPSRAETSVSSVASAYGDIPQDVADAARVIRFPLTSKTTRADYDAFFGSEETNPFIILDGTVSEADIDTNADTVEKYLKAKTGGKRRTRKTRNYSRKTKKIRSKKIKKSSVQRNNKSKRFIKRRR